MADHSIMTSVVVVGHGPSIQPRELAPGAPQQQIIPNNGMMVVTDSTVLLLVLLLIFSPPK